MSESKKKWPGQPDGHYLGIDGGGLLPINNAYSDILTEDFSAKALQTNPKDSKISRQKVLRNLFNPKKNF